MTNHTSLSKMWWTIFIFLFYGNFHLYYSSKAWTLQLNDCVTYLNRVKYLRSSWFRQFILYSGWMKHHSLHIIGVKKKHAILIMGNLSIENIMFSNVCCWWVWSSFIYSESQMTKHEGLGLHNHLELILNYHDYLEKSLVK